MVEYCSCWLAPWRSPSLVEKLRRSLCVFVWLLCELGGLFFETCVFFTHCLVWCTDDTFVVFGQNTITYLCVIHSKSQMEKNMKSIISNQTQPNAWFPSFKQNTHTHTHTSTEYTTLFGLLHFSATNLYFLPTPESTCAVQDFLAILVTENCTINFVRC